MTDENKTIIAESFARAFDSADDSAYAMRIVEAAAGILRAVIIANPDPQKRHMLELRFDGDGDGSWYVAAWSAESAPVAIAGYMRERDEALAEADRLRRKLDEAIRLLSMVTPAFEDGGHPDVCAFLKSIDDAEVK